MLHEVDRFTSDRHRAEPRLRTVSIWVGDFTGEQDLTDHLSPDDPDQGRFVREIGEDWYDSDALEATHRGESESIADLIAGTATEIGLPEAAGARLVHALEERGVRTANAVVLLHRHVFDGESPAGSRLIFAGSVDYLAGAPGEDVESAVALALARPAPLMRARHLFIGITEAATSVELQRYAREGGLVADWGGEDGLDVDSFDPTLGVVTAAHGLETGASPLAPAEFFALPEVAGILEFESLDGQLRAAARREIESVNALIAVDVGPVRSAPGKHLFCGLRSIGVHRAAIRA